MHSYVRGGVTFGEMTQSSCRGAGGGGPVIRGGACISNKYNCEMEMRGTIDMLVNKAVLVSGTS